MNTRMWCIFIQIHLAIAKMHILYKLLSTYKTKSIKIKIKTYEY